MYVYQQAGKTDSIGMSRVSRISHSRTDLQGVRHSDYVVMNVTLTDGRDLSYLLSRLDSVVLVRGGERIPLVRFVGGMNGNTGSRMNAPRRTSLDGDFVASASEVDFFWEQEDLIWLEGDTPGAAGVQSVENSDEEDTDPWPRAMKDFYFSEGVSLSDDEVTVYYPGQSAVRYNQVRVAKDQTQSAENSTQHIGIAGDCGVAVASKQQDGSYRFMLEHKAAYLCFLPYIGNNLERTILKQITVRCDSAIAGVFTLDPEKGMCYESDTTHVITLKTGSSGFVLPQRATQNTSAYMVIAPQRGSSRLTCEFTVYDTELQSEGIYTKTVDLDEIESNMVYVIRANCNNYVVDLGLPVKFLNHNMGAFAPEEYGGYYAYGELEDKGNYQNNNAYVHYSTPVSDISSIRLTSYDVAHMRLGQNFSIPTAAELRMLVDSCTWTWEPLNGKPGYKVSRNGNCLFIPAAGYRNGTSNNDINTRGRYRTSQLAASGERRNWHLEFTNNSRDLPLSDADIYRGESIRPVISTGVQMTDGTLVQVMTDSVQWTATQLTATLFGSVYGVSQAKTPVEVGFVVGRSPAVTLENGKKVASSPSGDGLFSASFTMDEDAVYYYRAYVRASKDSISYANTLQFGRCYVDMGLPSGTKWANISLGTAAPYEVGDYYAWAETVTKSSYPNNASNYRWYTHSTWTEPDRLLNIQATDNDAASVNWGDLWMMPDADDFKELVDNCTFTLSTMNGIKGYTVKSKINDNSFFMPLSGYFQSAFNEYSTNGYMASSTLPAMTGSNTLRSDYAALLRNNGMNSTLRSNGIPVRPVYKTNATSADNKPMFIRTLVATKQYDGTSETDTLKATVRGLAGTTGTTVGFSYSTDKTFATDIKVPVSKTTDGQFSYVFTPSDPGVTTYYRAYVCSDGTYYYGKTLTVDAVGVVDLGLSVLWANVDLGAASADSHGDFFRWGATKPFRGDNSNYYTGNKDITPLSGHDTATELWGSGYRMPTLAEFRELINNCDVVEETSDNGVKGRRFTSKVEGYTDRSIFLPTSGVFQYNDTYRYAITSENSHWTSTNYNSDRAYRVFIGSDNGADAYKNYGFNVRAVQEKLAMVQNTGFARSVVDGIETSTTLEGFFQNISGTSQTAGFLIGEDRVLDKDNHLSQYDVTTTSGSFQQTLHNLTPGKRYYYRAFAHDADMWKYAPVDSFDVVGEVDLGLSVKWANVNIGAQGEAAYGEHYQWGAKEPYYAHTAVQYYPGKENITRESGYDTAAELWGGSWRIPSKEEWNELKENCTWTWTNSNGQFGMRVKSNKPGYTDRSIFIPAAGYYWEGTWRTDNGGSGDYWTSSFYSGERAYYQSFWNNDKSSNPVDEVYFGFTVRPVSDNAIAVSALDVAQDATDFTKTTITCFAKGTPSGASVGVLYGSSRDDLSNDVPFATVGQQGRYSVTLTGLAAGSSYYYKPYIKQGGSITFTGDIKKFTTYELVDLDLPSGLLWMNIDLGADSICGNGDYYQWGALAPYPHAGWNTPQTAAQNLTETGYDAVRKTLGAPYRLATWSEMSELASSDNCDWEWTTIDDVPGYKVSSKVHPERFIFLPTTGWLNSDGALQYANTRGNFWSSSWASSNPYGYGLGGGSATAHTGDDGNGIDPVSYGSFLRPVLSVIETCYPQTSESAYLLRGNVNSIWDYDNNVRVGFVYSMSPSPAVGASGSTDVTVAVTQSGDYSYTLTSVGNTTYYYRAFIYDGTNYHYGAERSFVTIPACNYQAVDLGLPSGTKWANMNIGAETESGVGNYFAWGELYAKTNFSTATYEHYDNNYYKFLGEDIAGTKYDAVRAIMGSAWSMPTKAQYDELLNSQYTLWEWTTVDYRKGYRITSRVDGYTDRSIFLPASGWMSGTTLNGDNTYGYFWLSTYYNSNESYYTTYRSGSKGTDYDPRWEGFTLRGVINNGVTTAEGTVAAATTGVDWTIGSPAATLHGNYSIAGTVSDVTYGFVVGSRTDIDASTADAADIITTSGADTHGDYSASYNYDGGVRYFRAFAKVGDVYTQGEVKSIGAPMLLDVEFATDGTAANYAFTRQTCDKHGSPAVTYNATYKRYEADLSANPFAGTATHFYSVRYQNDEEFMARLKDGHTLEAVVKVPYLNSYSESDILSNYENGGSGIGIRDKKFFAQAYVSNGYRSIYDTDDLDNQTDTYHHVVSVYDKTSARILLYVDGQLVSSESAIGNHTLTTTDRARYFMVGGNPNSSSNCETAWKGSIVFARIYDDPLSAEQVSTLYHNLTK